MTQHLGSSGHITTVGNSDLDLFLAIEALQGVNAKKGMFDG